MHSLNLSYINYAITIWGATNDTQLQRVQKLQNFAAKVALGGARKQDHATPYLRELGWLKIKEKYQYEIALTVFKTFSRDTPDWVLSSPSLNDVSNIETRYKGQLFIPKVNANTGSKSLSIEGTKLWNSIPRNVRDANTVPGFKQKLKDHLK
ncbi:uncharacterized protein LOC122247550 [Penaeus japonicus]|uniref:uncharacterized protein LOC122247550 n=1 Tax=Penaeus japonicus TaxID=27405 RepID=UPI001C715C8B|nr:uncharacterized protein LOC122247550 [Penaeus japonicus]